MDKGFLLQFVGSVIAVAVLALAAWRSNLTKPMSPLDEAAARELFGRDFPGAPVDRLWIDADGAGAVARSGSRALILFRVGDCYASRDVAWEMLGNAPIRDGRVLFTFDDPAAPRAAFRLATGAQRAPFA